jgi:hypothetical protein
MHALRMAWLGLLLVANVGACHSKGEAPGAAPKANPNTPVLLEVENHYQGDVVIYLMQGNQRERLGMVTALSKATYTFPYRRLSMSGNTRLLAYPIAGRSAYASDPLLVQPGQSVSWTLESDLDRSSLAVW